MHDSIEDRLRQRETERSRRQAALNDAQRRGKTGLVQVLRSEIAVIQQDIRSDEVQLGKLASNGDALAGEIAAAGLDTSMTIVEEHRPEQPQRSGLVLIMIAAVIGTGALLGSALVLGAFDSRVHDTDDVTRLGLPVLGHVPGFTGDDVGSMQSRSASRARVPSFQRWRSHR
jgi:hypothetical protein